MHPYLVICLFFVFTHHSFPIAVFALYLLTHSQPVLMVYFTNFKQQILHFHLKRYRTSTIYEILYCKEGIRCSRRRISNLLQHLKQMVCYLYSQVRLAVQDTM